MAEFRKLHDKLLRLYFSNYTLARGLNIGYLRTANVKPDDFWI
jgi:hypothetical protein